ncbi:TIGR03808 family TAT-translocated repetitive protein [Prosthecomicrobium sp. N25]|uniref:TIGR03808 family TAT-translocated repetitive protein n=1 Tax=Prosthecomicrobium sp. N25 TaxID=3129254 RepID=UPI003077124F
MLQRRQFVIHLLSVAAAGPAAGAATPALAPGGDLQEAIDRAARAGEPVTLGPGTFAATGLKLPDGTRLVGVPGRTRLVAAAPRPIAIAEGAASLHLTGLTFDGGFQTLGAAEGIVALAGVADLHVDSCAFTRTTGHGLRLQACAGRVERSSFTLAGQAGLFSLDASGLVVRDNRVEHCGNGGILVWRSAPGEDGTLVSGNRIARIRADAGGTGQNGNGINFFRAGGVIAADNRIADCAFTAIRANSASNVQMTGNQCLRSGETALYAEFAFEGALIANNLVDGAAVGISVTNFNEGGRLAVVSGNIVRNLRREGPYRADPPGFGSGIAVEADTAVTGNVVEGAPLVGIAIGFGRWQRDVTATGNVVRNAGIGISVSVADGAGPALVADNLIRGARSGAIVGFRGADAATGDLARGGVEAFPFLTIERNRVAG